MKIFLLLFAICSNPIARRNFNFVDAFAVSNYRSAAPYLGAQRKGANLVHSNKSQVLILDHLNINHEKGRHDLLKAFYFDFLQCAVDPRKEENLVKAKKTLWANIGAQQFHLPEGNPSAQVFQGIVTLAYPSTREIVENYEKNLDLQRILKASKFSFRVQENDEVHVTDPWGSQFRLIQDSAKYYADTRGKQPGEASKGIAITDLTVFTSQDITNFAGIARFYEKILGALCLSCDETSCVISVGPKQTLSFRHVPTKDDDVQTKPIQHDELEQTEEGISNYGAHISMYITDLRDAYQRANDIGVTYVNPRFKRRAYTIEEAVDDCMFRILDIVDPENLQDGPILKLEHEVRSVVKPDGSKYKSCPFDEIPSECRT